MQATFARYEIIFNPVNTMGRFGHNSIFIWQINLLRGDAAITRKTCVNYMRGLINGFIFGGPSADDSMGEVRPLGVTYA
jgi:hypothetical protein